MSTLLEQWQRCLSRQGFLSYQIATAVADGLNPRQNDIDRFKANEAEMRDLESKFSEDT